MDYTSSPIEYYCMKIKFLKLFWSSVFMAIPFVNFSQTINLDTLFVGNVIEIIKNDIWVEGFGEGPYINGKIAIKNNIDGNVIIGNSIFASYYHEGFKCNSLPYFTSPNNEKIVRCGDSLLLDFEIPLLFGTFNKNKVESIKNDLVIMDYSRYIEELSESILVVIVLNGHPFEIRPKTIIVNRESVLFE